MTEKSNLKLGMQGQAVRLLKIKLQLIGFNIVVPQPLPITHVTTGISSSEVFDAALNDTVREFQKQQDLPMTGIVDLRTTTRLDQMVERSNKFAVLGTVAGADGKPLPNVIVKASDRDVGKNTELNKATTDTQGRYTIFYDRDQFSRAEKANADLVLAVNGHPDYKPDIIFNALPVEIVNLVPEGTEYKEPSEYQNLLSDLAPLLVNVAVPNAPQAGSLEKLVLVVHQSANRGVDPKKNDLIFMRQEMNALSEQFDALVAAINLSEALKNKFAVAFVYGLIRQNLPSELHQLLSTTKPELVSALVSAFSNNIIPFELKEQELKFIAFLQKLSVNHQIREATSKEKSSLVDLLRLSGVAKKAQNQYAKAVYENTGSEIDFFKTLVDDYGLTKKQVSRIEHTLTLGRLVDKHAPMVNALLDKVGNADKPNYAALAKLELKDWEQLIRDQGAVGFPVTTQGKNANEKRKNYAVKIKQTIERLYSTETIAHKLPGVVAKNDSNFKNDIQRFFERNTAFSFDQHTVVDYLKNEADTRGIQDVPRLQNTLAQTQRLIKVVGKNNRLDKLSPLLQAGYQSAAHIASQSQNTFFKRVSGSMPEPVALEVYSLSSSVSFISESLKTRIREWVNPAVPAAIPPAIDPDILSDLLGNGTNEGLSEIFGSLNRCACEHCQSAYSPAAYYVDLLHELKKTDEESGALTELFNRRPDLEFIQLSCANTNTVIPYIDLVNEVLESAIELGEYQNQTGATGKTQAELKARWEYQNDRVYSFVNRADLNWSPIFEPDFVQANALLDYFKIDTTNCLGVIGEPNIDGYTEALITLGVSSATADVFTTSTTNSHGLSHKLTEIMQQSGLEYDAVEQLLALTWLNPEGVIEIKFSPEESCDLDNATLIGIDKTSANKIWRFLRLNAALNWQIDDLGSALAVASDWAHQLEPDADNPDRVAFTHLASLYKLSKRTGYDLLDVAAWFSLATSADTEDVKSALALQRLNAIANAVNISVDEVNDIADLMGVDLAISSEAIGDNKPLSPSLAIEFLDSITLISELKIDVGQLRWVLKNKDQQPAVFEPKVETVDAFLTGLWDGGEKLREQLKELHESTEVGSEERLNEEDRLNRLTNEFIITQLTSYTSSTEAIISTLLEQYFADTDYSISALQTFVQAESLSLADSLFLGLKKLAKATAILDMFGLTHEVLSSSVFSTANLVLPEEEIIGFEHWLSFASLVKLNKQFLHWEVSLFKTVGEDRSKIESITGWPAAEVEAFVSEPALGIDLSTPEAYEKLSMLFALQKKLDATSADVIGFIEALKNQNYAALSTLLNSAGKRKLGESRWFEVITPINNVIREQKRDVLVNYLETEVLPGGVGKFSNASEIYAYYLIDPEMSSCRQTSRIKNAISAVQLYIQRIRMGLESVEFSKLGRAFDQEWDWRKNYRVWEANRKVFLYPENYIFPELRDDQTIFFKEFVSKLLQDELTENNIEYAVDQYLEQMDEVARLDIRAIYQDEEPDGDSELHILARTHGENPKYFYRKKNKNLFWLGWQPVDIDIKGDHHALVKHNGRLQLIWMTFEERGDGEEVTIRGRKSNKDSFLELHSSEYGLSGWIGSKKILEQIMPGWLVPDHPPFHEPVVISRTLLKTKVIDYKLHIAIYLYFNGDQEEIISFVYDECLKTLVSDESNFDEFKEILVTPQEFEESRIQYNLQYQDMKLVTDLNRVSGFIYPVSDFDGASESTRVTRYSKVIETSRHYSLLSSSQKIQFRSDLPFIFEDSFGAFIVRRTKQYRRSSISEIPYWPATFEFRPFYHPFACSLIKRLRQKGLPFLYGDFHSNRNLSPGYPTILGHQSELREGGLVVFEEEYGLEREVREPSLNHGLFDTETIPGFIVKGEIPEPDLADEKLDFSSVGAYSIYNWELFFHIPLHTAQLLTQAGKHEEAQIWLHRVFNPTDKSTGSTSNRNARVWRIAPFYKEALKAPASIEELLVLLRSETDETEDGLLDDISAWRSDPFNPHLLARMRISAYMRKTVLQYLDNLIQWGDYLFRRHTIESINEASNIYIMAYELLGPKPTIVSKNGSDKTSSFADFEFGVDEDGNPIADLDAFSNVFFEDLISDVESTSSGGDSDRLANTSIIKPLFFCIPGNSDLLKYWDIVADRLFKIRHCQDISGRSRSLPLFELPIDPALLVRARAAGLDINSVLDGLYGANRPTHRVRPAWA